MDRPGPLWAEELAGGPAGSSRPAAVCVCAASPPAAISPRTHCAGRPVTALARPALPEATGRGPLRRKAGGPPRPTMRRGPPRRDFRDGTFSVAAHLYGRQVRLPSRSPPPSRGVGGAAHAREAAAP